MSRGEPGDAEAVRAAFLNLYLADQEVGHRRDAEEYAARFPGFESVVAGELARLATASSEAGAEPGNGGDGSAGTALRGEPTAAAAGLLDGRYRLGPVLGRGGQGTVYRAQDATLGRTVAVKVLDRWGTLDPGTALRFRREAEVASRLEHPAICRLYDASADGGIPYIVMQYVAGETLARHLARRREDAAGGRAGLPLADPPSGRSSAITLGISRILGLAIGLAEALHLAHEAGIVHRDVKPGNVMVTEEGRGVLLDFGLARDESPDASTLTLSGVAVGTPPYMSPEQVRGETVDRRTDVWSLGALLYECLAGRRPFEAPSREGTYREIVSVEPTPPSRLARDVPRDLDVVVATALAKEPDRRYATAADLGADLRRVLEGLPIAARPLGPLRRAVRWARRRPMAAALVLLITLGTPVVTGLATYAWVTREEALLWRRQAAREERERRLEEAYLSVTARRNAAARATLEELLASDPDDLAAAVGLCADWAINRSPRRAKQLLARLRPRLGASAGSRRLEAALVRAGGDLDDAARLEAALPEPQSALDHFLAGVLAPLAPDAGREGWRAARRHFREAVMRSPHARPLFHFALAHACVELRDRAGSRVIAEAIGALWPDRPIALFWEGAARREAGDHAAAMRCYERAEAAGLDTPPLQYNQGTLLLIAKRLDDAEARFRAALEADPRYPAALRGLAGVRALQGRMDEGLRLFRRAIALDAKDPESWSGLIETLCRMGRLDEAAEAAARVGTDLPASACGPSGLARVAHLRRRHAEAVEHAEAALERDPEHASTLFVLGNAVAAMGQLERAVSCYRRCLDASPLRPEAHNNLAETLRRLGKPEEALLAFGAALETDPGYVLAHERRAGLLMDLGRLDEARERLEAAEALRPDHAKFPFMLGHVHFKAGRYEEARACQERALAVRPGFAPARGSLGLTLERLGRFEEALPHLRRAVEEGLPLGKDVARCEARRETAARVARWKAGEYEPSRGEEAVAMAAVCHYRGAFADAAALYALAFSLEPELERDLVRNHRYHAACVALRAAIEDRRLEAAPRARLARGGRAWLDAAVTALERDVDRGRITEPRLERILAEWTGDPDLAFFTRDGALAVLGDEEAAALGAVWQRLLDLR